ncbi:hypothetical protein, partial [Sporisorium scitamineum]
MSAKSQVKRSSMLGSLSVADRAKVFQSESTGATAAHAKPLHKRTRKTKQPSSSSSSASTASRSPPVLPSSQASASSTQAALSHHHDAHEPVAVIKHARRISVSTPIHRRARSDVSILDPFVTSQPASNTNTLTSQECTSPPTIRTSFAQIGQLAAELKANRPHPTTTHPRRARASSVLMMHSIAEENMLRMRSSTETIRGVAVQPTAALREEHVSFHVSPCLSEDGSIDWHHFVTANYGIPLDFRRPISITDLVLPIEARKRVYESKLCKADSPTLNDEATWLEEELANCSSDDAGGFDTVRRSLDEEDEYVTPEGSPLLSPVNVMAPPQVEIMGLGIQDVSLLMPGQVQAGKSADSLLEQVAMHEACIATLHTLTHEERDQASAIASAVNSRQLGLHVPAMPDRRSSLTVPHLRGVRSTRDFSATQSDSELFDETYDASLSPMADMGHGGPSDYDACGERRASAASYLSTDSTASADVSIGSHASSLLYNAHLAPGMQRAGSADTSMSTRPSSIASSYGCDSKTTTAPVKPPRSPLRMNASQVLPAVVQESCDTPTPAQRGGSPAEQPRDLMRMKAMPLPPLPPAENPRSSKESARLLRRKVGTDPPQPPARLDSLDTVVAAAPKEIQLREEFPDRLLGDWMAAPQHHLAERKDDVVRVEPIPLHKRINKDGATYLPGLGEIVPPSPDVAAATPSDQQIPVYPGSAAKLLGVEPYAPTTTSKSTTLKTKLSGRFGITTSSNSNKDIDTPDSVIEPWKDRIVAKRPSLDLRRPSLASLTSTSTHSSTSSSSGFNSTSNGSDSRSRSSLGFRKMLSSITGTPTPSSASPSSMQNTCQPTASNSVTVAGQTTTLQALAATTFESPNKSARRNSIRRPTRTRTRGQQQQQQKYESFMQLSDDDDDEEEEGEDGVSIASTVEEEFVVGGGGVGR